MIRPAPRFVALCLAVLAHPVLAGPLAPTQPAMPGKAVSLNAQTIDLTLGDAVFLGLRDNRAIRSAYLERIAQKFDLRVAADAFNPAAVQRLLDVFLALARAAAHPVAVTQLVQHGAADALAGKGFKQYTLGRVELLGCFDQADHAHLDQIVEFDAGRQAADHHRSELAHQSQMLGDVHAGVRGGGRLVGSKLAHGRNGVRSGRREAVR